VSSLRNDDAETGRSTEGSGDPATAAQHNQANIGVYADVVAGGTTRRGDSVTLA
jgi:hypothetical protein